MAKMTDEDISFLIYQGDKQAGPYSQQQILAMLQEGRVGKKDLVYYEGLGEWKPIDEVFEIEEQLSHFMNEGQEPEVVADVFRHIEPMLGHDEQIFYIGHQRKKIMRQRPDAAIITNRRLLIQRQTLTGTHVEDCQWRNVVSVHKKEGLMGTNFSVLDSNDHVIEVEDIPKEQIDRLCQLAQEMRE
jgi:Bacterial PH domain/GYF domain 2